VERTARRIEPPERRTILALLPRRDNGAARRERSMHPQPSAGGVFRAARRNEEETAG